MSIFGNAIGIVKDSRKRRWFLGYFLLTLVMGAAMAAFPHDFLCSLVSSHEQDIIETIKKQSPNVGDGAGSAFAALKAIVCKSQEDSDFTLDGRLARVWHHSGKIAGVALFVATALSLLIGSRPIKTEVEALTASVAGSAYDEVPVDTFARLWLLGKGELGPSLLRRRRLRIMVVYALVSGIVTLVVPPTGEADWSANLRHIASLVVGVLATVVWGVGNGSWTQLHLKRERAGSGAAELLDEKTITLKYTPRELAIDLGFAPVFLAGLIALSISLPYQQIGSGGRLDRNGVVVILAIRLLALPTIAAILAGGVAVVFQKWGHWPRRGLPRN